MLDRIVAEKRREVGAAKAGRPRAVIEKNLRPGDFAFDRALRQGQWSLIAECKLASPAKGKLCHTHTVPELARLYSRSGAAALSVHTDRHFCGDLGDIAKVRSASRLPILRKDFMIDEYQIYEARGAGADAVLLIAAILSDKELRWFIDIAKTLGMDSLVEVHSLEEIHRLKNSSARLVGINNRNLKTFTTDIQNTFMLLPHCDPEWLVISESGISTGEESKRLKAAGIRGALVGEGLVRAPDIAARVRELALSGE